MAQPDPPLGEGTSDKRSGECSIALVEAPRSMSHHVTLYDNVIGKDRKRSHEQANRERALDSQQHWH